MSSRGCGRAGSVGRVRALAVRLLSKRRMVSKAQKLCHAGDLQVGGGLVGWVVWFLSEVTKVDLELVVLDGGVGPADDVVFSEDGHGVVATLSFRFGGVGFEAVAPAPEMFEAGSVAHDGIEGTANGVGLHEAKALYRIS